MVETSTIPVIMHYLQEVFGILKRASVLGERKTRSGATLLGAAPHIGSDAWLHTVFPPLDENDVDLLESEIGIKIPDAFLEFLELTNGLKVFSDSLAILGRRESFDRTSDDREPYSIVSINLYERMSNLPPNALLIGCYSFGSGFSLYLQAQSQNVFRCKRSDARPLKQWTSFGEMLLAEVRRLDGLFDSRGKLRDPRTIVVPAV
jgi:hypothetical protein